MTTAKTKAGARSHQHAASDAAQSEESAGTGGLLLEPVVAAAAPAVESAPPVSADLAGQLRQLCKLGPEAPESKQQALLLCRQCLLNGTDPEPMLKRCQIVVAAAQQRATVSSVAKRLKLEPEEVRACLEQFIAFGFVAMHTPLSRRLAQSGELQRLRHIAEVLLRHQPNEVKSASNPKLNASLQSHSEWTMRLLADCLNVTIYDLGYILHR